jgi:pimeloyl-ACP methyl ester carboxylesterase
MHLTGTDGRTLDVHDSAGGAEAPITVVWHHGSPQTGAALEPHLRAAAARGIRWISFARAGYGATSELPDRSVADAAADLDRIADALGLGRFAVMGASGGGPHALAATALLGDRVWGAATLATLAPYTTEFDWFAGMAGGGPSLVAALDGREARELFEQTAEFDGESFNARDYAALSAGWVSLDHDVQVASSAGSEGLVDDDLAFVKPWGVDLDEIASPVLLVHGGDDRVVPATHSRRLVERLPDAELWLRPRDGHISVLDASPLALDWLVERAPR